MKKYFFWLLILLLFFPAIEAAAAVETVETWELINSNEMGSYFFNSQTISLRDSSANTGKIYVDVWIMIKHTALGKMRYLESLRKNGVPIAGYQKLNFSRCRILLGDGVMAVLSMTDYSDNGDQIFNINIPNPKWEEIESGSTVEEWYRSILEYTTANLNRILNNQGLINHQDFQI